MAISAAQVKALRDKTGLSMMDCKKALEASNGDENAALEWLRERGLQKEASMTDRVAGEGRIAAYIDKEKRQAAIIELRCETAPVANTDDFVGLANKIAKHAALNADATRENLPDYQLADGSGTIKDAMSEVFNRLREKMEIAKVERFTGEVGAYVHFDGRKGAMIELSAPVDDELASGICMHITAMNPPVVRREDVDPAEVQKQREAFQQEAAGKPPEIMERIVNGKIDRWYSEFVLLEQPYVKEEKKTVAEVLKEANPEATVTRSVRMIVGG